MNTWRWLWRGTVERVIDGDTLVVLCDCGYDNFRRMHLRLKDVNAAELHARDEADRALAKAARDYLMVVLPVGTKVVFETFRLSFERYVADVWFTDQDGSWAEAKGTIQDRLVEAGSVTRVK